jgi:hypothetical protein
MRNVNRYSNAVNLPTFSAIFVHIANRWYKFLGILEKFVFNWSCTQYDSKNCCSMVTKRSKFPTSHLLIGSPYINSGTRASKYIFFYLEIHYFTFQNSLLPRTPLPPYFFRVYNLCSLCKTCQLPQENKRKMGRNARYIAMYGVRGIGRYVFRVTLYSGSLI